MNEYLRSKEAAQSLGVTTRTLHNWADRGILHPIRLPTGRERRWNREEIEGLQQAFLGGRKAESGAGK